MKVHASAVVAWSSYAAAFALALALEPALSIDLATRAPSLLWLAGGIVLFFAIVVRVQREMGLALRAAHFGEPDLLVTTGSFALSRNPMYVAFLIPLASLAAYSPAAALAGAGLYVGAMTIVVIRPEERAMRARFGERFDAYCARTPRWLRLPLPGRAAREA